jgi:hypothetical protein
LHSESARIRTLINQRLELFYDPQFALKDPAIRHLGEEKAWAIPMRKLSRLKKEKHSFLKTHGYSWALHRDAYNSTFEALLQWRLMNVLSDIDAGHPALDRCSNMIVKILPTSSARPHLREVEQHHVIVLPAGYFSALKGFIRLWLRGCAIGQPNTQRKPMNHCDYAVNYAAAIQHAPERMSRSAQAYVGTLLQLLQNEVPFMDHESTFDGQILKREEWGGLFGMITTAVDGFLLFHEAAHVLAGDTPGTVRTTDVELEADRGSASLCIIDEARRGGKGTVNLGAPVFFCVELLRHLCEEILEMKDGRQGSESQREPVGIEELKARSVHFIRHVKAYLGERVSRACLDWTDAMMLVFDTVRWALLNAVGNEIPLQKFITAKTLAASTSLEH